MLLVSQDRLELLERGDVLPINALRLRSSTSDKILDFVQCICLSFQARVVNPKLWIYIRGHSFQDGKIQDTLAKMLDKEDTFQSELVTNCDLPVEIGRRRCCPGLAFSLCTRCSGHNGLFILIFKTL